MRKGEQRHKVTEVAQIQIFLTIRNLISKPFNKRQIITAYNEQIEVKVLCSSLDGKNWMRLSFLSKREGSERKDEAN